MSDEPIIKLTKEQQQGIMDLVDMRFMNSPIMADLIEDVKSAQRRYEELSSEFKKLKIQNLVSIQHLGSELQNLRKEIETMRLVYEKGQ